MSNESSVTVLKEGAVFKSVMPVRWGDMDAVGHVNNTLYFRYVEEARAQCFDAENVFFPNDRVPLLAHASFDFIKSVIYPATVVVIMTVTRLGRSSLTFDVVIETQDEPGVAYAKGKNVVVAAERTSGQSSPWTAAELSHLARFFV
ncbi:MAG: thioesterase family protein [Pusillimonas sp.]